MSNRSSSSKWVIELSLSKELEKICWQFRFKTTLFFPFKLGGTLRRKHMILLTKFSELVDLMGVSFGQKFYWRETPGNLRMDHHEWVNLIQKRK